MTVSVVIPAYNAAKFIDQAVASVLAQDRPADEIIVVDDGSTDRDYSELQRLHASIKVVRQPNRGVSAARNVGCDVARSEYIAILDADDVWVAGKLRAQMRHLEAQPGIDAAFCEGFFWRPASDGSGWTVPEIARSPAASTPEVTHLHYPDFLCGVPVAPSTMVVRKSAWTEINGFDERIRFGEDHDFYFRLSYRARADLLRMVGVLYRQHSNNASAILQQQNHWAEVVIRTVKSLGTTDTMGHQVDRRRLREHLNRIRFLHGYEHFWAGNFEVARREFAQAARLAPWEAKSVGYLMVSSIPGLRALARSSRRRASR